MDHKNNTRNKRAFSLVPFIIGALITACATQNVCVDTIPPLTSINIIDRNGISETISTPERLGNFSCIDFESPLPYGKVLRIHGRDGRGDVYSFVNAYYENGQPQQYLEVVNGRACGIYKEWHSNGILKLEANVIGGTPDLNFKAQQTWIFDGRNCAWDENGTLIGEINYCKGDLEGISCYYHCNGNIWKREPYCKGLLQGTVEIYLEDGQLLQTIDYQQGIKDGLAIRFWSPEQKAAIEEYCQGVLKSGSYFDRCGTLLAEIKDGNGFRAVFGKTCLTELQEYRDGQQQGEVKVFTPDGFLINVYKMKDGDKHGEEFEYYDPRNGKAPQPKLSIDWVNGAIQGYVKTWYPNGIMESQREMSCNLKNGLLTGWYKDGSVMLIEEYEKDKLVKGEYYRKGEKLPVSRVQDGAGYVTTFDADGTFLKKILYHKGRPLD